jgi:hypothetical protein
MNLKPRVTHTANAHNALLPLGYPPLYHSVAASGHASDAGLARHAPTRTALKSTSKTLIQALTRATANNLLTWPPLRSLATPALLVTLTPLVHAFDCAYMGSADVSGSMFHHVADHI